MADFRIKKGMNIRLAGQPRPDVSDVPETSHVAVFPTEFKGVKPRLLVKEGDSVKRGTPLFLNKLNESFQGCAPASGTIESIQLGLRRVVEQIIIKRDGQDTAEPFGAYPPGECKTINRQEILEQLQRTGYLAYIRQRPFSCIPDPSVTPKSIFVNAMATAPFQTDFAVAVSGHEQAFQAGLHLLTCLTDGTVHLVLPTDSRQLIDIVTDGDGIDTHCFHGPHPAGNTSVHIHHLDPISPGSAVWTIRGDDLIQIGRLFLTGELPKDRAISVGGPGVESHDQHHYRVPLGSDLDKILDGKLVDEDIRIINGDVLGGTALNGNKYMPFYNAGLTVLREDRNRHFLGWLSPGLNKTSHSRVFLSAWFKKNAEWVLGTSQNGSLRAMVLTELYDKFMPMNIMVDYLVRAILANDTEEAVALGILETDPEDFALCAFACPSKMDLVGIIRGGLNLIEEEGI